MEERFQSRNRATAPILPRRLVVSAESRRRWSRAASFGGHSPWGSLVPTSVETRICHSDATCPDLGARFREECAEQIALTPRSRCNRPHEGMDGRGLTTASSRPLQLGCQQRTKAAGRTSSVCITGVAQVVLPDPCRRDRCIERINTHPLRSLYRALAYRLETHDVKSW